MPDYLRPHELQHARLPCLPEFAQTYVHWVGNGIQTSHPLSPTSVPAFSLSQHQGLFQWVSSSHQVANNWSFNISPSSEYSGLISTRIDWFDLLAVQGTLKSQLHSLKASISQHSAFFVVHLLHLFMTTGKSIALTIWIFVGKMMSLLLNMLSRFVIAFLPKSKCLNFMAEVTVHSDFGAQENKNLPLFLLFPLFICHEVVGLDAIILVFWMLSFKPALSFSSLTLIKSLFSSFSISAIRVVFSLHWESRCSYSLRKAFVRDHSLSAYVPYILCCHAFFS